MTEKFKEIQNDTSKDVLKKLKQHHKCLLVRPTGFGKTKTSVDIAKRYKHAVFLYPFNNIGMAIKKYDLGDLDAHFYTYSKLRNAFKCKDEFRKTFSKLNFKNTIFVIDEAHFIGAVGTSKIIEALMKDVCPKANYFGITATPNRTDKLEVKWHFFDGITAYEYGLKEAFKDSIFAKPYYVFTPLEGNDLEKVYLRRIDNLSVSENKKTQLKAQVKKFIDPQKLNIENLDEVIRNNLYKFKNEDNYYKFIAFFTTFNDIHVKRAEVVSAFQKVFPDCEINVLIVSSESTQFKNNLKRINDLKPRENTIDLIFSVNMLTFGYHVDDLTGIMMFRSTISNIIYAQQVGRCLSVVQNNPAIIFDFVENLYKSTPNSVIMFDESTSTNKINEIDLLMPEDEIELNDEAKEILEIKRLIDNAIREEFEEEVVTAYKAGLVEMDYCVMKLQLHDSDDFMKILKRYENGRINKL